MLDTIFGHLMSTCRHNQLVNNLIKSVRSCTTLYFVSLAFVQQPLN